MNNFPDGPESFTVMYGSHTFRHTSAKVTTHVFEPGSTVKLNKYLTGVATPVKGTSSKIPARPGSSHHGHWFRQAYAFLDGLIIGFRLYATINTGLRSNSIILVRLRHDGPFLNVKAQLPTASQATYNEVPVFVGNGDVLSPGEVIDLGVNISRHMRRNLMDQEEVEEDFKVESLNDGAPKPEFEKIKTKDGEVKVVALPKQATRRVRVRR